MNKILLIHVAATHEEMFDVVRCGPIEITKVNPDLATLAKKLDVLKTRKEWIVEDKKRENIDYIAQDII